MLNSSQRLRYRPASLTPGSPAVLMNLLENTKYSYLVYGKQVNDALGHKEPSPRWVFHQHVQRYLLVCSVAASRSAATEKPFLCLHDLVCFISLPEPAGLVHWDDSWFFSPVQLPEVLLWSKEQNEEKSPNLTEFTQHFNSVSFW